MTKRIIVAISGASGAIYGIRLLLILRELKFETHLIISEAASITIEHESSYSIDDIKKISTFYYKINDIGARISSGSFITQGMIISPCSMNTLAMIAGGLESNLISRVSGVVLKERRKLVLMTRETPLHSGHLENMLKVSNYGGIIAPPIPSFYIKHKNVEELVDHSIYRVLDLFSITHTKIERWGGIS